MSEKNKWIDIKEKLPELELKKYLLFPLGYEYESSKPVLVWSNLGIHIATFNKHPHPMKLLPNLKSEFICGFSALEHDLDLDDVTHWQPLPNPPTHPQSKNSLTEE